MRQKCQNSNQTVIPVDSGRFDRNAFVYNEWIRPLDMGRVLDVGCGANYIKTMHSPTIGIDILGKPDVKVDLENGKIPFKRSSFDCVVCLDVLEHLDNMHDVIKQIVGITKNYIILSFPNELRWLHVLRYLWKTNDREFGFHPRNRHKWFMSYSQSRDFVFELMKEYKLGFVDEHVELGSLSSPIHSLIGNRFPNLMPYRYYAVLKKLPVISKRTWKLKRR